MFILSGMRKLYLINIYPSILFILRHRRRAFRCVQGPPFHNPGKEQQWLLCVGRQASLLYPERNGHMSSLPQFVTTERRALPPALAPPPPFTRRTKIKIVLHIQADEHEFLRALCSSGCGLASYWFVIWEHVLKIIIHENYSLITSICYWISNMDHFFGW